MSTRSGPTSAGAAGDLRATLRPVDRLSLAFLAVLGAVALACHPRPGTILLALAAVATGVVVGAAGAPRGGPWTFVHDFFPVLGVILIFSLCGPLIEAANPARWDATLAALDRALFGSLASAWYGVLGRPWWLTDAAYVAYCGYYVLPVAIAAALWRGGRAVEFEGFVFTVVATFFASYVGYFLVPASGPRVPAGLEDAVLGGGAPSAWARAFLRTFEVNRLDAFPSGHTALSLVYLVLGWRLLPRWRLPIALVAAGTVFATVYLSLHYVVDVVAGALLAALMPLLLPPVRRAFQAPASGALASARATLAPGAPRTSAGRRHAVARRLDQTSAGRR
ncbi:MAG: phosphatase PAP2 family protein [Thermodesulfobacteriota bacterium]